MQLPVAVVESLAQSCAPAVAVSTLVSVARVESDFDPLAIGVNGANPQRLHARTVKEAVSTADRLIRRGANVDLGLGQINSANLANLGINVADAFEPCRNLHAAAQVLQAAYRSQRAAPGQEQPALRIALSLYNTGRTDRGFLNGYVAKVVNAASGYEPALHSDQQSPPTSAPPSAPGWDVFAQSRTRPAAGFVLTAAQGDAP
jgi:type IV secretion system protein VirB1